MHDIYKTLTHTKEAPQFTLNLNSKYVSGKTVVVDLSWYEPYKQYGDDIICAFVYLIFIWHVFKNASAIINGAVPSNAVNGLVFRETLQDGKHADNGKHSLR